MQTTVKKWFRDNRFGFLDNGDGPDIHVSFSDLSQCEFLKIGAIVTFDCHMNEKGLFAKNVTLVRSSTQQPKKGNRQGEPHYFGVMGSPGTRYPN